MPGINKLAVTLLLLLMCSSASASLLVSVSPKDPSTSTLSLYLDEAADYELEVFNDGPEPLYDVLLKATASEGLRILDLGLEKSLVSMKIAELGPGEKETMLLKLKPVELSTKNLFLYVDYGVNQYTHLSATYLSVEESPLQINASLSKTALDLGDEASVSLSLKNGSQEPLRNIRAELLVFSGLESMDGIIELDSLAPGEGYEAKEFLFRADPTATGKKPLILQVTFEDSQGKHLLEKNFFVEIQSKQIILYLIGAVIILLVFVAILSRKRPEKAEKLEKPIVQELADSKIRPGKE